MIISVKVGKYYAVNEIAKAVKLRKTFVERLASREEVRAIKGKNQRKTAFVETYLERLISSFPITGEIVCIIC